MVLGNKLLRKLRDLKVAVVHPRDVDGENLIRQLQRIGCRVNHFWPAPNHFHEQIDVVFFWMNQEVSESHPLLIDERTFALIAIIGSENPTLLEAVIAANANGIVNKPIQPFGILAALANAYTLFRYEKRLINRIEKLDNNLKTRRIVEQATKILCAKMGVGVDEAYAVIRREAMNKQISLAAMASAIIKAEGILQSLFKNDGGNASF